MAYVRLSCPLSLRIYIPPKPNQPNPTQTPAAQVALPYRKFMIHQRVVYNSHHLNSFSAFSFSRPLVVDYHLLVPLYQPQLLLTRRRAVSRT